MSDTSPQSKSNFVAWFAVGCGVLLVGAVVLLLFGGLFLGVGVSPPGATTTLVPAAPAPAPTAAQTPEPAPAPTPAPADGEQR
jgi:hypothetical protein